MKIFAITMAATLIAGQVAACPYAGGTYKSRMDKLLVNYEFAGDCSKVGMWLDGAKGKDWVTLRKKGKNWVGSEGRVKLSFKENGKAGTISYDGHRFSQRMKKVK